MTGIISDTIATMLTRVAPDSSTKAKSLKASRTPPGGSLETNKMVGSSAPDSQNNSTGTADLQAATVGKQPATSLPPAHPRQTKAAIVEGLLSREGGASIEAMCEATGWQAHSCRAFLSGLKKKGRTIIRSTDDGGRSVYMLAPAGASADAVSTSTGASN